MPPKSSVVFLPGRAALVRVHGKCGAPRPPRTPAAPPPARPGGAAPSLACGQGAIYGRRAAPGVAAASLPRPAPPLARARARAAMPAAGHHSPTLPAPFCLGHAGCLGRPTSKRSIKTWEIQALSACDA